MPCARRWGILGFGTFGTARLGSKWKEALLICDKSPKSRLPGQEEVTRGSHENEAPGDQGSCDNEQTGRSPRLGNGLLKSSLLFRLSRRADQWPGAVRVPISRQTSLASATMSAQPESQSAMDADDKTGGRVSPEATYPSSLAQRAVRRQTPKVGSRVPELGSLGSVRGRSEMGVPTGNAKTPRRMKRCRNLAAYERAE
jgi:hypothetical protein